VGARGAGARGAGARGGGARAAPPSPGAGEGRGPERLVPGLRAERAVVDEVALALEVRVCPGRKPSVWAINIKRPARRYMAGYKTANKFINRPGESTNLQVKQGSPPARCSKVAPFVYM
jgi:hypothetical protein